MVELKRRQDARIFAPDVSSAQKALGTGMQQIGGAVDKVGDSLLKKGLQQQKQSETEYLKGVEDKLKTEQKRIADQRKVFDAADKMAAADAAGQLENELLRWNLQQRAENPTFIGTPEHERAMRDQYSRLADKYGKGLGEVGLAAFQEKTQGKVNDFIGNDIKWAYQQKIKQGEVAAANAAKTLVDTAEQYGASGDIEGFKQAYSEGRQILSDYADGSGMAGASMALAEVDMNALLKWYKAKAETDPLGAKNLLDSMTNFSPTVPEDMVSNTGDILKTGAINELKDKIAEQNAALSTVGKNSPAANEIRKNIKQYEKELKNIEDSDWSGKSLYAIHDHIVKELNPIIEKSLGEKALLAREQQKEEAVANFCDFLDCPTTMRRPNFFKGINPANPTEQYNKARNSKFMPSKEFIDEMDTYAKNWGTVSFAEISKLNGTKPMFDGLNDLAKLADGGDTNNILLKAVNLMNEAKASNITESDYNNFKRAVVQILGDKTYRDNINQFMEDTKGFMPNRFWNSWSGIIDPRGSNKTRINEEMDTRVSEVLTSCIGAMAQNPKISAEELNNMYIQGVQKAFDATTKDWFDIDLPALRAQKANGDTPIATIHGIQYVYQGDDTHGNPLFEKNVTHEIKMITGENKPNKLSGLKGLI